MVYLNSFERQRAEKAQAWLDEKKDREAKAKKAKAAKEWEEYQKRQEAERAKEAEEKQLALEAECKRLGTNPELLALLKRMQAELTECREKAGLAKPAWQDSPAALDEFGRPLRDLALISSISKDLPASSSQ